MVLNRSKGSVVGFIIVGVLLFGLIAGGVYSARHGVFNGVTTPTEVARDTPANETTETSKPETTQNNQQSAEQKRADELSAALKKQAESEKKAKEQNQAATSAQQSSTTESDTAASTANQQSTPNSIPTTGVHLPQTGPVENALMTMLALGALVASVVAYARSRALI